MVKKALSQSDFEILKSAISKEQLGDSAWFLACWYRINEGKNWFEHF